MDATAFDWARLTEWGMHLLISEFLLVVWGFLFIANQRPPPDQKGRNFIKSAQRGKEAIVRNTVNATNIVSRRNSGSAASASNEARPDWDNGQSQVDITLDL